MVICNQCGHGNEDGNQFCIQCGSSLGKPKTEEHIQHSYGDVAENQAADSNETATAGISASNDALAANAVSSDNSAKAHHRKPLILIIAALVTVSVVVSALLITRTMELWGPRTIPVIQVSTAQDAVAKLKEQGFSVTTKKMFSSMKKGAFIGLDGVKQGDKISRSTPITVMQSLGPGVPEGTVGKSSDDAISDVKDMGVPVTVNKVISNTADKVVATNPSQGNPVLDISDGIHIGVGVKGEGIPIEIAGMDKDSAKSDLESQGFTVDLQPRFSGKDNMGKIVSAQPSIGAPSSSKNVVLYYGADASQSKDVVAPATNIDGTDIHIATGASALAGQWCTDDGDCIALDDSKDEHGNDALALNDKDHDNELLSMCNYSQNPSAACAAEQIPGTQAFAMTNHLLAGDSGAFEIYANQGLPYCGDSVFIGGIAQFCIDGKIQTVSVNDPLYSQIASLPRSGLEYKMDDFMLVVPVGAHIDTLEQNGYFKDSKQGDDADKPDATRPYILRRDPMAYDQTTAKYDSATNYTNPFVPSEKGKPVKFAPYPSAQKAYYLVENPIQWDALDVDAHIGSQGTDASSSPKDDEAKTALSKLAGDWTCYTSDRGDVINNITITEDGSFSGTIRVDDQPALIGVDHDVQHIDLSGRFTWENGAYSIHDVSYPDGNYTHMSAASWKLIAAGQSVAQWDPDSEAGRDLSHAGMSLNDPLSKDVLCCIQILEHTYGTDTACRITFQVFNGVLTTQEPSEPCA
ncbi:zinc-ribbon domain-containing protein [Bifidobacterium tsurumiense]|uniref:zinc-ribbon domain-containing protein n=1 Tax=Bifidobacterium tsurumiense TaxID=356829 RepID=UPI0012B394B9|nr:zinc-ribbon domain-containing protein [Bifidobacterium tsurumiense]MSS11865.1 hypothetical protein [Bifidobacterium tsurumiense]